MAWEPLKTDYVDAVFEGLRKYQQIINSDGTYSFADVTNYLIKEGSFIGAKDINTMNVAMNLIMAAVNNGTNLYDAFTQFFADQQTLFEKTVNDYNGGFEEYLANLREIVENDCKQLENDYTKEISDFIDAQESAYNLWYQGVKDQCAQLQSGYVEDITKFKEIQETAFNIWFDLIKNQLNKDAAGHLQQQIGNLNELATEDKESLTGAVNEVSEKLDNVSEDVKKEIADGLEKLPDTYAKKSIYDDTTMSLGRREDSTIGEASVVVGGGVMIPGMSYSGGGTASGRDSAVVGGVGNYAMGHGDIVLGGGNNRAGVNGGGGIGAAIVGGSSHQVSSNYSAIVGGGSNIISSNAITSVILGGSGHLIKGSLVGAILGGTSNTVSNGGVVIGGAYSEAKGQHSAIVGGFGCESPFNAVVIGHVNDITKGGAATEASGTGTGTAFEIGNGVGSSNSRSNAVRIDFNGKIWCKAAYSSSGADYAELFEWADGNPDNEERFGYFVTMDGMKIKIAEPGDWVLGIVSANPAVLGNSDMEWQGQFERNEFNAYIIEHHKETVMEMEPLLDEEGNQIYEQVPILDEEGNELYEDVPILDENGEPVTGDDGEPVYEQKPLYDQKPAEHEVEKEIEYDFYMVNSDYDPEQQYIDRLSRPEWDAVGMMGVLPVWDDGTCEVNGYCTVAPDGTATKSAYGYRVAERVNDHIIKVILNCETDTIHENKISELEDKISRIEQQIQQLSGM